MFNGDMRDKLLFEDADFTYSRRYFWAYQTLGLMNDSIKAIMDAYEDTFTDDVWEGKHKSIWPMVESESHRNVYWRKRMASLKKEFEREIKNMFKLYEENDDRRKEIRTLRDQLFSGTSVLESRKSVELSAVTILQGHNIKLLTLVNHTSENNIEIFLSNSNQVSIFFLPLTFVTSVFGMSNMPDKIEFTDFTITMVAVCVPFFLLIGSLNTTSGMEFWRSKWHIMLAWVFRNPGLLLESTPKPDNGNNPGKPETHHPYSLVMILLTRLTHCRLPQETHLLSHRSHPSSRHPQSANRAAETLVYLPQQFQRRPRFYIQIPPK